MFIPNLVTFVAKNAVRVGVIAVVAGAAVVANHWLHKKEMMPTWGKDAKASKQKRARKNHRQERA